MKAKDWQREEESSRSQGQCNERINKRGGIFFTSVPFSATISFSLLQHVFHNITTFWAQFNRGCWAHNQFTLITIITIWGSVISKATRRTRNGTVSIACKTDQCNCTQTFIHCNTLQNFNCCYLCWLASGSLFSLCISPPIPHQQHLSIGTASQKYRVYNQ